MNYFVINAGREISIGDSIKRRVHAYALRASSLCIAIECPLLINVTEYNTFFGTKM